MKKPVVADILNLEVMSGYRIVAGKNGLENTINFVSVYDNLPTEIDRQIMVFDNDIYLSFMYHGKQDETYITNTIKFLIDIHASALIIMDEYINDIPHEAKELCDEAHLPVIFISSRTPYALIINSITKYRLSFDQVQKVEDKLNTLTSKRTSQSEKNEILEELNPHFQKYIIAFYCISSDKAGEHSQVNILTRFNNDTTAFASQYGNGILILQSYSDTGISNLRLAFEDVISTIRDLSPNTLIGISNPLLLADSGHAISQSFMACDSGSFDSEGLSYYKNLGIMRLLLSLLGEPEIDEFYDDMTSPILKYDEKNNTNLFDTMLIFAENAMDYIKTSKILFVHENTIRYRIGKIRELIQYGSSDIDFYETISVLSKIHKLRAMDR